jgi:hypothetical protein
MSCSTLTSLNFFHASELIIRQDFYPKDMGTDRYNIRSGKAHHKIACLPSQPQAVVKPNKTNRLVLRCDACEMLLFANATDAQA